MDNNKQDLLWRQLARQYITLEGAALQREAAEMEAQNLRYFSPRMDARIARLKRATTRRVRRQVASAVAACVLLAVMIPVLARQFTTVPPAAGVPAQSGAAPSAGNGLPAAPLLPMDFPLPANLSVAGAKLDNGKTVYYLSDTLQDDVVLTMEETGLSAQDTAGLRTIDINGQPVYVEDKADYKLLLFEKDGILYTLTCQYDVNTLLPLAREIL